jgi:hypothetical protein
VTRRSQTAEVGLADLARESDIDLECHDVWFPVVGC